MRTSLIGIFQLRGVQGLIRSLQEPKEYALDDMHKAAAELAAKFSSLSGAATVLSELTNTAAEDPPAYRAKLLEASRRLAEIQGGGEARVSVTERFFLRRDELTTDEAKRRLEMLPVGKDAPVLVRVGVPVVREALDSVGDAVISRDLADALWLLERRSALGSRSLEVSHNDDGTVSAPLYNDLLFLGALPNKNSDLYLGPSLHINRFREVSPVLRKIALRRCVAEIENPSPNIRREVVGVLGDINDPPADAADLAVRAEALFRFMRVADARIRGWREGAPAGAVLENSLDIALRNYAVRALMSFATDFPEAPFTERIGEIDFVRHLEDVLEEERYALATHEAGPSGAENADGMISIPLGVNINEYWNLINMSQREAIFRALMDKLGDTVGPVDQMIILDFMLKHSQDMPPDVTARLSERVDLFDGAGQMGPETARFQLKIGGEKMLARCKYLFGNAVEQGSRGWSFLLDLLREANGLEPEDNVWLIVGVADGVRKVSNTFFKEGLDELQGLLKEVLGRGTQTEIEEAFRIFTGTPRNELAAKLQPPGAPDWEALFTAEMSGPGLDHFVGEATVWPFIRYLWNRTNTNGELEQVRLFLRDFGSLSRGIRISFVERLGEESHGTGDGQAPMFSIRPTRARDRLRTFISEYLYGEIEKGFGRVKAVRIRGIIEGPMGVWKKDNFLRNLSFLLGFSTDKAKGAILKLISDLTSVEAVGATKAAGGVRILNPGRYRTMKDAFSEKFIRLWSRDDGDFVVDMGPLSAADPETLRRTHYGIVGSQLATHLGFRRAEAEEGDRIFADLRTHVEKKEGVPEWTDKMVVLLTTMENNEVVTKEDLNLLVELTERNEERFKTLFGNGAGALAQDLKNLSDLLSTPGRSGHGWLVVTSDPAAFLASGYRPVLNCQTPLRETGWNWNGEPVARPMEGRHRLARVLIANNVSIKKNVAVISGDAVDAGAIDLEVTTASGKPDPSARPHLLVETIYPAPGLTDYHGITAAIDTFAKRDLHLNPKTEVHNAFADRNMKKSPHPLPDGKDGNPEPYRDTFRLL